MKICIVSDSHDHRGHLAAAVTDAKARGAEAVLHCGDLVAPSTLHAITPLGLPIHRQQHRRFFPTAAGAFGNPYPVFAENGRGMYIYV